MPRKKLRDIQDRRAVLKLVPADAERVKVRTEIGENKYKTIADLADKDIILTKADGTPIIMKAKPGRSCKVELTPANDVVAEVIKRQLESMDADAILRAVRANPDSSAVLTKVIEAIGTETAALEFARKELERDGKFKDTPGVSFKRIQGLKALGETWLRRKDQMVERAVDTDSPGFKAAYRFILETLGEAMQDCHIGDEQRQTVFAKYGNMTRDPQWQEEMKRRIRDA